MLARLTARERLILVRALVIGDLILAAGGLLLWIKYATPSALIALALAVLYGTMAGALLRSTLRRRA